MFSLETNTDELIPAIGQLICILISEGSYSDQLWTLLKLEEILKHLYQKGI